MIDKLSPTSRLVCVVLYVGLSAFCAAMPTFPIWAIPGCLWVFGPPANLIHGSKFLGPFSVGTALVATFAYVAAGRRTMLSRFIWTALVLGVWAIFGSLAYGPGA